MRAGLPALVLLLAAWPLPASSRSQRGAALFAASGCQHCHSMNHVGGHKGPDLSDVGRTVKKAALRRQIMEGGRQMPPFEDVLEPAEVKDLVAYLHSCREKPAR